MDRRTILAFVLLTLVLILFQYFSPKPAPRAPSAPPPAASTEKGTGSEPSVTGNAGPAGTSETASTSGSLRNRFVNTLGSGGFRESPLLVDAGTYRAKVEAEGARLTEWNLQQYTDSRERPADLVADSTTGLFHLGLILGDRELDLSRTQFQLTSSNGDDGSGATLTARDSSGATVRVEYRFPHGQYAVSMKVRVDGFPNDGGKRYLQVSFPAGIANLETDPRTDYTAATGVALLGERYVDHRLGRGPWQEEEDGMVRWAGVRSKYFLLAAIPQGPTDGQIWLARPGDAKVIQAGLRAPLNLSGPTEFSFKVYAGPMKYQILESYGVNLEKAVDLGGRLIVPFSRLLLKFFLAVHLVVPNFGLVILVLSVLSRLLFYPLTKKSMESMKQMQLLKPELDRLNEKYKDDAQRRNQATLELYKKNGVNPLGGCLPLLIQMPILFALYRVLNSAIELRKAPFLWWIRDLSAPDRVGSILGFPIHLLPLVMAATMIWQQKLTPTDPRQASIAYVMPIFMTIFFYMLPSGLVFYWTVNNLMSIGQQMWMNRNTKHQLAVA